jgi:hypothetical protein
VSRSSWIVLAAAAAFAVVILTSARSRRTHEKHTLGWLSVCAAVAALAIWRPGIDVLAHAMGVYYPPSALFFLCCAALLLMVYRLSAGLARERERVRKLAQEIALLSVSRPAPELPPAPRSDAC